MVFSILGVSSLELGGYITELGFGGHCRHKKKGAYRKILFIGRGAYSHKGAASIIFYSKRHSSLIPSIKNGYGKLCRNRPP